MRAMRLARRYGQPAIVTVIATVLWWIAITPTGFGPQELVAFTAPGAVLALSAQWARYLLRRDALTRKKTATAAATGAMILPPIIAFGIAVLSAFNRAAIVVIFVLGAWTALGGGLLAGAFGALWSDLKPTVIPSRQANRVIPSRQANRVIPSRQARNLLSPRPSIDRLLGGHGLDRHRRTMSQRIVRRTIARDALDHPELLWRKIRRQHHAHIEPANSAR
jgi:hypothetical protein